MTLKVAYYDTINDQLADGEPSLPDCGRGTHSCNFAKFEVRLNGVYMGVADLNNGSGGFAASKTRIVNLSLSSVYGPAALGAAEQMYQNSANSQGKLGCRISIQLVCISPCCWNGLSQRCHEGIHFLSLKWGEQKFVSCFGVSLTIDSDCPDCR